MRTHTHKQTNTHTHTHLRSRLLERRASRRRLRRRLGRRRARRRRRHVLLASFQTDHSKARHHADGRDLDGRNLIELIVEQQCRRRDIERRLGRHRHSSVVGLLSTAHHRRDVRDLDDAFVASHNEGIEVEREIEAAHERRRERDLERFAFAA